MNQPLDHTFICLEQLSSLTIFNVLFLPNCILPNYINHSTNWKIINLNNFLIDWATKKKFTLSNTLRIR